MAAAEAAFSAWCAACGCPSPLLELAYFPVPGADGATYRGLRAVRDVPAGVHVLSVPLAMCLHSQAPPDWPYAGSTPASRLATRLLAADLAGADAPCRAYLDVLPRDMDSLGLFSLPLRSLADGVQGYGPLLRLRARMEEMDAAAQPQVLAHLGGTADAAAFAWAMAMVRTRAFEVTPGVDAFIPWFDLANHAHTGSQLEWSWDPDARAMQVHTVQPLAAGEEAFTTYGARDNDGFLLWGGFLAGENPHDTVEVFASLAEAAAWWLQTGVGPHVAGATGASSVSLDDALRAAAAIDAAAREEAGPDLKVPVCLGADWNVDFRLVDLFEQLAAAERELGPRVAERAAVAAVRARAAQAVAEWPTSAHEDGALLAAGQLQASEAVCVQFRRAKKQLLLGYAG